MVSDDYAKLSFLTGRFAAIADARLNTWYFVPIIRAHAWSLTWEKLAAWEEEAVQMGVPRKAFELTKREKAMLPARIAQGRAMQEKIDAANPAGRVH